VAPAAQPEFYLADVGDVWLRHVVEGGAIRSTHPRVKTAYLERKLERVPDRPWEGEISGRLLSKANDIRTRAIAAATAIATPGIEFRHAIYVRVSEVRKNSNFDVYAEPKQEDDAHANLVAKQMPDAPQLATGTAAPAPKVTHEVYRTLAGMLMVCDADNLAPLESLRSQIGG
jgi:hypothetical protein